MNLEILSTIEIIITSRTIGIIIGAPIGFIIGLICGTYCCVEATDKMLKRAKKEAEELKEKENQELKMLKIKFEAARALIEILESKIKKDIDSMRKQ